MSSVVHVWYLGITAVIYIREERWTQICNGFKTWQGNLLGLALCIQVWPKWYFYIYSKWSKLTLIGSPPDTSDDSRPISDTVWSIGLEMLIKGMGIQQDSIIKVGSIDTDLKHKTGQHETQSEQHMGIFSLMCFKHLLVPLLISNLYSLIVNKLTNGQFITPSPYATFYSMFNIHWGSIYRNLLSPLHTRVGY